MEIFSARNYTNYKTGVLTSRDIYQSEDILYLSAIKKNKSQWFPTRVLLNAR